LLAEKSRADIFPAAAVGRPTIIYHPAASGWSIEKTSI
jgi:hypothetical protein